jgi:hypothetical protein
MGWSNWMLVSLFMWMAAPILARGLRLATGRYESWTTSYADWVAIAGFVLLLLPMVRFAASWIVMVVKVSLVHSWATEGRVFSAPYYYRNVFHASLPTIVCGAVLILARRLLPFLR